MQAWSAINTSHHIIACSVCGNIYAWLHPNVCYLFSIGSVELPHGFATSNPVYDQKMYEASNENPYDTPGKPHNDLFDMHVPYKPGASAKSPYEFSLKHLSEEEENIYESV